MVGCTKTVQLPDDMLSVLPLTADEVPPVVVHSNQVTEQSAELLLVTEEVQPAAVSTELLGESSDDVLSTMLFATEEVQPVVVPSDQVTEQSAELLSLTHEVQSAVHELPAEVLSASLLATQSLDVQYYMLNERALQLST